MKPVSQRFHDRFRRPPLSLLPCQEASHAASPRCHSHRRVRGRPIRRPSRAGSRPARRRSPYRDACRPGAVRAAIGLRRWRRPRSDRGRHRPGAAPALGGRGLPRPDCPIPVELGIAFGVPAIEICRFAEQRGADLLVIGRKHRLSRRAPPGGRHGGRGDPTEPSDLPVRGAGSAAADQAAGRARRLGPGYARGHAAARDFAEAVGLKLGP